MTIKELAAKYQVDIGYHDKRLAMFFNPWWYKRIRYFNTLDHIHEVARVITGPLQNPYGAIDFEREARTLECGIK